MNSPAVTLGSKIRLARKATGLTIAQLAEEIGRPREWLNRLELGYSEYGEHRPPSQSEIRVLHRFVHPGSDTEIDDLLELGRLAEAEFHSLRTSEQRPARKTSGRLTQTEVILGEEGIIEAVVNLIHSQEPNSVIRNTGIRVPSNSLPSSETWARYGKSLGQFLSDNPMALLKRIEFAPTKETLALSKVSDVRIKGPRDIGDVHNAKVKFSSTNPFQMHVLIGQREAIMALPHIVGHSGSNIAILIRDKQFIEALRIWYDEVLWDGGNVNRLVRFSEFDQSFREIADMYGIEYPAEQSDAAGTVDK